MSGATGSFDYRALDATGKKVSGAIVAETREAAVERMIATGLVPLTVKAGGTGLNREIRIPGLSRVGVKHKELVLFVRELATMVAAGVPLLRALSILAQQLQPGLLRTAVLAAETEVRAGTSFSQALADQEGAFPELMIHLVRAGETGGFLDEALDRVAIVLEAEQRLRSRVWSAMAYPLVVLGLLVVIVTAMLVFIVPIFEGMFADLGGELPGPTQALVFLSANFWWIGPALLLLAVLGALLWRRALKQPAFRVSVDDYLLRMPLFGALNKKVALSRFARTMATLLGSAVPMLQAIEVAAGTAGNAKVAESVRASAEAVRNGQPLSRPLAERPEIFPAMLTQMLAVGEETGRSEEMLDKVATFYEQEVESITESLSSLLEPLLIVVLGVVVGFMVVALYLPMFTIYDQI